MKKILVQTCIVMEHPFYCYILCWFINGFHLEYWFAVCTKETIDAIKFRGMKIIKTSVMELPFQYRKLKVFVEGILESLNLKKSPRHLFIISNIVSDENKTYSIEDFLLFLPADELSSFRLDGKPSSHLKHWWVRLAAQ